MPIFSPTCNVEEIPALLRQLLPAPPDGDAGAALEEAELDLGTEELDLGTEELRLAKDDAEPGAARRALDDAALERFAVDEPELEWTELLPYALEDNAGREAELLGWALDDAPLKDEAELEPVINPLAWDAELERLAEGDTGLRETEAEADGDTELTDERDVVTELARDDDGLEVALLPCEADETDTLLARELDADERDKEAEADEAGTLLTCELDTEEREAEARLVGEEDALETALAKRTTGTPTPTLMKRAH
ncbi:hypothetical protein B0H17DRAFT_1333636 [Mycena rosella]|uniref:Uncharacterized protein n=1 Tax=Mycena rosella TaxID=1033263 RepID=A0AAD7D6N5_MYCRO|nr:hypothetical protein B0H17DRAFT_1333636 [Mycena rosella]